jgi:shikimate dehydrogenase
LTGALDASGFPGLEGEEAVMLGAGGAARAVLYALLEMGAGRVRVVNRGLERARALCKTAEAWGFRGQAAPEPLVENPATPSPALVVNATSVGMDSQEPDRAIASYVTSCPWVVDLVYRRGNTALAAEARAAGATCVDGSEVLVAQGALSLEIWTGRPAPRDAMRAAVRAALERPGPEDEPAG